MILTKEKRLKELESDPDYISKLKEYNELREVFLKNEKELANAI